jgi:hypothetical protein
MFSTRWQSDSGLDVVRMLASPEAETELWPSMGVVVHDTLRVRTPLHVALHCDHGDTL